MVKIDRLIRSRRKTISLIIRQDGSLEVRAPLRASEQIIRNFVEQKQNWIYTKQKLVLENKQQTSPKLFINGEDYLYLGKKYPLQIVPRVARNLMFNGQVFLLGQNASDKALSLFEKW